MIESIRERLRTYVFNFNAIVFCLLVAQNAIFVLLTSYTQQRNRRDPTFVTFNPLHFLLMVEFVKLVFSVGWCLNSIRQEVHLVEDDKNVRSEVVVCEGTFASGDAGEETPVLLDVVQSGGVSKTLTRYAILRRFRTELSLTRNNHEALLMGIPGVLYAFQNAFIVYALSCLDPTVYQITYQLRVLMTAVGMKLVLGTAFTSRKWLLLCILFVGVCCAQTGAQQGMKVSSANDSIADPKEGSARAAVMAKALFVTGILSAFMAACLSAISSVLMEYVFKKRSTKCLLSTRNIHLSFFSIVYFSMVSLHEFYFKVRPKALASPERTLALPTSLGGYISSYLDGFDLLVWLLVVNQAVGGILVAMVMRYMDNIMKSLATALALVLSGVGSVILFELQVNLLFVVGCSMVMAAVTTYNLC